MAASAIVRLLAETSGYNKPMQSTIKQMEMFRQKNLSLNGVLAQGLSVLTKFAGGFAAAEVATKAFNAVIMEGSQTTGDFIRNGLNATTSALSELASSFATLDFTNFHEGFVSMIKDCYRLSEAMDTLANKQMAMGLVKGKYGSQFNEALTTMRDPDASKADKQKAAKVAQDAMKKISDAGDEVSKSLLTTVQMAVEKSSGIKGVTWSEVEKIIEGDVTANAEDLRKSYSEAMKAMPRHRESDAYGEAGQYDARLKAWQKEYREEIIGYAVLTKASDKQLQSIIDRINATYQLKEANTQMQRSFNKANASLNKNETSTTTKTKTSTKSVSAPKTVSSTMKMPSVAPEAIGLGDTTESMNELNAAMKVLTDQLGDVKSQDAMDSLNKQIEDLQARIDIQPLALKLGLDTESALALESQITSMADQMRSEMKPIDIKVDTTSSSKVAKDGKESSKEWKLAAQSVSQLGSAMQGVDNKAVNVAGIIMEAIANVALGFAAALSAPGSTGGGVFSWIAAAAAGLATMVATIASIKKATSAAEGGIVPGAYNGGKDSTYVYASPGEVILNRAQQQNLLGQLDSAQGGGTVQTVVRGEQIVTALNNYGRRKGYGEVAWR